MTVRLYDYWRSSASYRVRIALNLGGIAYQAVPVNLLTGEHRGEAHRALNPQGFVPALEIDGERLTQSLAILDYLVETRGLRLLPDAVAERAHVRALAHSVAVDVHPVCNLSVAAHVAKLTGDDDAKAKWMRHFITPGLAAFAKLRERWDGATFACGDAPGLADICLIPQIYNARRWGAEVPPALAAIEAACSDHPAFAAAAPEAVRPD